MNAPCLLLFVIYTLCALHVWQVQSYRRVAPARRHAAQGQGDPLGKHEGRVAQRRARGCAHGAARKARSQVGGYHLGARPRIPYPGDLCRPSVSRTDAVRVSFGSEHRPFERGRRAVGLCSPCLWWWGRLCRRRCGGGCARAALVLVWGGVSRGYTYHPHHR